MSNSSHTLVLIGCGSSKRDGREYSFQMYSSDYFCKKVAYASTIGEPAILSAKYGVLYFDDKIDNYNTHITDLTDEELQEWVTDVESELNQRNVDKLVLLIPKNYIKPLKGTFKKLENDGVEIVNPFEQTEGIGEQVSLLADKVEREREP